MKKIFVVIVLFMSLLAGCSPPALYIAAGQGDLGRVQALLDQGTDVNENGGGGLSNDSNALSASSSTGHIDIVKILLDRGADINKSHGNMGWTPLSDAAWFGHADIVELLIDRGADVNKAIAGLRRGLGTADAVELIKKSKRERAASQSAVSRLSAESPSAPASIKSDVDELPSIKAKLNKNSYAIVIGIEHYRQKLPAADFATHDARTVADYLTKALGFPEENVVMLLNERATNVDLAKFFEKWLSNNVDPGSSVFIYYSGHGAPNPNTGDAYLVPYDGDPSFIDQTGYSLNRMYEALGKLPAKNIVVALDSCFSGAGGRSVIAKGSRPLVMNLQKNFALPKNMTVLSASSGDQTSSTYDEKGHGLFTYFMLKGIKNEEVVNMDGSLEITDLYGYLKPQVERIARKQYNNEQTPQLIGSR